jgi:uncharacterized membrane protein YidH (DUF202 family)
MTDEDPVGGVGARDPGLARERTELAWNRSGLAMAVTIGVILRRLWPLTGDKAVAAVVLIAAGGAIWAVGMQLSRRTRLGIDSSGAQLASTCRMLTIGTLLLAVAAFVVGVLYSG